MSGDGKWKPRAQVPDKLRDLETTLQLDDEVKRDGLKHKRFVLRRYHEGTPVDSSGHWRSAGTGDWQKVPVPDEETFFGICGLPVPRPEQRNAAWFSQMTARPSGSREMVVA